MNSIYDNIKLSIKLAMIAKAPTLQIFRGLDAAIQLDAKNKRVEITDDITIGVIVKGINQRKESIIAFTNGNRPELVAIEQRELEMYQYFLPKQLSADEINEIIYLAISSVKQNLNKPTLTIKDMGLVNKIVMPQIKGKADGKEVSEIIKKLLT